MISMLKWIWNIIRMHPRCNCGVPGVHDYCPQSYYGGKCWCCYRCRRFCGGTSEEDDEGDLL